VGRQPARKSGYQVLLAFCLTPEEKLFQSSEIDVWDLHTFSWLSHVNLAGLAGSFLLRGALKAGDHS
jgi:hypothetical protein